VYLIQQHMVTETFRFLAVAQGLHSHPHL
jgi:hypothetical protein